MRLALLSATPYSLRMLHAAGHLGLWTLRMATGFWVPVAHTAQELPDESLAMEPWACWGPPAPSGIQAFPTTSAYPPVPTSPGR